MEGHPEKAIERFAQGIECCRFEGPTMFVYRAECWLRIGHLERALSDVDAALASKPPTEDGGRHRKRSQQQSQSRSRDRLGWGASAAARERGNGAGR